MADDIQSLPGETWKPVVGYDGIYSVSDHGRVWSHRTKKFLRGNPGHKGHLKICLNHHGTKRYTLIHREVLLAFVGPCPDGHECCHGDRNPANNHVSNLRWGTYLENWNDRKKHGTGVEGTKNPKAKLTEDDVREMRKMFVQHRHRVTNIREIMERFNISHTQAWYIIRRKSWAHVV